MDAKKGAWVQIHDVILKPEERTARIPEDTKKVPLELWVKGYLKEDAAIGQQASVVTVTGRTVTGTLCEINPRYEYGFGNEFVPELLVINAQVKNILNGVG